MEWLTAVRTAIDYIERNLTEDISPQDAAEQVFTSPFFLQRGFSLITGCGVGEYIRCRRLYRAAVDLKNTDDRVIDIALRYCWETPESFAKAFTRFHGASPTQVRDGAPAKVFLPMTIELTVNGGNSMDCRIENKAAIRLIGFERVFDNETAYAEIPIFWAEIMEKYAGVFSGRAPADETERAIVENGIGEYGVCIDDMGEGRFRYLIAGKYAGGSVPSGMTVCEFPQGDWAVFDCIGPLPEALQSVNTRIFREWLPGNPDWELCGNASVEWYGTGTTTGPDYKSAIWVPVRKNHSAEAERKWGGTAAYAEYERKTAGRSRRERADIEAGLDAVFAGFAECMARGCATDSPEARSQVNKLQSYITENFYTCTDEILLGLGKTYTADERFKTNIDRHGDGTAKYVSRAIEECFADLKPRRKNE